MAPHLIALSGEELSALTLQWLWPLLRVAGFVMAAPVIGTRSVPARVKLMFALAVTAVLVPVLGPAPVADAISPAGLLTGVQQVLIGTAIGAALRLVFLILELAGQIIAMQMGLGFAAMVDPQTGAQVPVVAQFYVIIATLLFLAIDGHLMLVGLLADSFRILPVGPAGLTHAALGQVLDWAGWLLVQAVVLALPAVIGLLVVNVAFGIMTRAAPQLNVFAVGFPVTIIAGTAFILLGLSVFAELLVEHFAAAAAMARALLAGG